MSGMKQSIIQAIFTDLNRGGRIIADANCYTLLKTVSSDPSFPGRDRIELLSIPRKGLELENLTRVLCSVISDDLRTMHREYEADANELHKIFRLSQQPVDIANVNANISSPYMRNRFDIHTDYDLVDEQGDRARLFYMDDRLIEVGPDQVEMTVRRSLRAVQLLPDVNSLNEASEQLKRFTLGSCKDVAP